MNSYLISQNLFCDFIFLRNEKKLRGKSFDKNNLNDVEKLVDEIENLKNILKSKDDAIKSLKKVTFILNFN